MPQWDENGRLIEESPKATKAGVRREWDEQGREIAAQPAAPARHRQMSVPEDIGRSATTGAQSDTFNLLGLPGDLERLYYAGTDYLARGVDRLRGQSEEQIAANQAEMDRIRDELPNRGGIFATGEQLNETRQQIVGPDHVPQTVYGEYADTIGGMAPMWLFPGTGLARTARVVVPGAISETAGQATEGTPYEPLARAVGAIGSGVAVEYGIAANADRTRRALGARAEYDAQAPARAREDEWMPLTAGERAGDPRAMQRESSLRRNGPEQAQTMLRDFDNARAETLQQNMMSRIATRGRDPRTESIGDAGVVVADDLRSGHDAMRQEQARRYARADELSRNVPVAPTDELAANVARVVDEDFLDATAAVNVVNRLSAQIRAGQATYASVERARQQLNRLLGSAMRTGEAADVYAIHRVIDELDAFVEPRLAGDAQRAIREARGYTREMLNMYGTQARPNLSTGHTGSNDLGGRLIERILDTDMTGEQVIDSIFRTGQRPSAGALAAVRRINERATRTTSTGGYDAPSAPAGQQQRAPRRRSQRGGRATRGGRQFQSTTEAIDDPTLQALREAFVYRLGRRMTARQDGDAIPARQMASDLRAALDGSGKEITPLLFNSDEIDTMRRALAALDQASMPAGSYNPSAPGIAQDAVERSLAAISARVLGGVPWVGPGLQASMEHGIVNARAIKDAAAAVARPQAPPIPRPATQQSPAAGVTAGAMGSRNSQEEPAPTGEQISTALGNQSTRRVLAQRYNARQLEAIGRFGRFLENTPDTPKGAQMVAAASQSLERIAPGFRAALRSVTGTTPRRAMGSTEPSGAIGMAPR